MTIFSVSTLAVLPRLARSAARCRMSAALLLLVGLFSTGLASGLTLKIATVSPDGSTWMKTLRSAGKTVQERTEGRVKLKFFPGGVQGDDKTVLRKMKVGGLLHGGVMTVGVLAQYYPDLQIYGLPMVFSSDAELDYVRSQMDAKLMAGLEQAGYVGFGFAEVGNAYAMSQRPIATVAEARAGKNWVPDGDLASAKALQAFGIAPIPLTIGDVLAGLQTGLIDTIAAPPVGTLTLQWHTRLSHVMDLPLLYTYGLLVVTERQFKKISAADQVIVREVMGAATAQVNARSRVDHEQALAVLQQQGLTFATPTVEARAEFQRLADVANENLVAEEFVSAAAWQELQRHRAAAPVVPASP
ncbi:MAG: TRAP transporter substrate-binding protein DctP [Pseudomonadales bacterium]